MQDYNEINKYIKRKYKKENFFVLNDPIKERVVLDYIEKKQLKITFYQLMGFDITRNHFFVREYTNEKPYSGYLTSGIKESIFENFNDLYIYVNGNIYEHSCFYGYQFTEDEIKKYKLDLASINMTSFSQRKINEYSFKKLHYQAKKATDDKIKRAEKIKKWFNELECPNSYEILLSYYKDFKRKFAVNEEIFYSILIAKFKDKIKDFILEFFCKVQFNRLYLTDLLVEYGSDIGQYILENFNQGYSSSSIQKYRRGFKKTIVYFEGKSVETKIGKAAFDNASQLYYVHIIFKVGDGLCYRNQYFLSFTDFVEFLDGDLSNCDLTYCKEPIEKINKFKINESTKMPMSSDFSEYKILKKYKDDKFFVYRKWLDANGEVIIRDEREFTYFADFAYFLNNDLSDADLIMCPNLKNLALLKNLNLENAKVTSDIAEILGIKVEMIPEGKYEAVEFNTSKKYELDTVEQFSLDRPDNFDYPYEISYVTDVHLIHRIMANKCKSQTDASFVLRNIIENFKKEACGIALIGGDIASDIHLYEKFIKGLEKCSGDFFITLGNHELWKHKGMRYEEIVSQYATLLDKPHIHFVHNNIFMCIDHLWEEIKSSVLINMTVEQIRESTRKADLIIFGGIAFAGFNNDFNANEGIYRDAISREEEIQHSKNFEDLYHTICAALDGKNVIVLTHMPFKDWTKDEYYHKGFVYVSGHSHKNFYLDDNDARVFADNQIGYKQKEVHLKKFRMNRGYNWFEDYKDGIYEITRDDYVEYYRGIKQAISFNRQYKKLLMLKREDVYLFLMENEKGNLCILNGGSMKKAPSNDINYFYENMVTYSKSMNLYLSKYFDYQKEIAKQIKSFGGYGTIHGSIIDIDFFNHIYINPLDGTITPYYAYSMVDKYVYKNLPSLLSANCSKLFLNLTESLKKQETNKYNLLVLNNDLEISDKHVYVESTEMYKVSWILKGLQLNTNHKIIRFWSDSVITDCSEELGKNLVSGLLTFEDKNE